jgi:hypothetical protein
MTSLKLNKNGQYSIYDTSIAYICPDHGMVNKKLKNRDVPYDWYTHSNRLINEHNNKNSVIYTLNENPIITDIPEYIPSPSIVSSPSIVPQIFSIDDAKFWQLISKIGCRDKDEGTMRQSSIRLSRIERSELINAVNSKYMPELKAIMDTTAILEGINAIDYDDLLMHIIAKGKSFYQGIITDPVVGLYLCDQFYPVYTWLTSV